MSAFAKAMADEGRDGPASLKLRGVDAVANAAKSIFGEMGLFILPRLCQKLAFERSRGKINKTRQGLVWRCRSHHQGS